MEEMVPQHDTPADAARRASVARIDAAKGQHHLVVIEPRRAPSALKRVANDEPEMREVIMVSRAYLRRAGRTLLAFRQTTRRSP
jgi:hypothetical protein